MLVLTRAPDETILIGDKTVEVRILSVKGNRVRLGISAPRSIKVMRGELPDSGGSGNDVQRPA